MDVQGVAGGTPAMDPAQSQRAAQEQQQAQAPQAEATKQEVSGGTAPGVGQNLNITV